MKVSAVSWQDGDSMFLKPIGIGLAIAGLALAPGAVPLSTETELISDPGGDVRWFVTPALVRGPDALRPTKEALLGDGREVDVRAISAREDADAFVLRFTLGALPPRSEDCGQGGPPDCWYAYLFQWNVVDATDGSTYRLAALVEIACWPAPQPCGDYAEVARRQANSYAEGFQMPLARIGADLFEITIRRAYFPLWDPEGSPLCAGDEFAHYEFEAKSMENHEADYYFDLDWNAEFRPPLSLGLDSPGCAGGSS